MCFHGWPNEHRLAWPSMEAVLNNMPKESVIALSRVIFSSFIVLFYFSSFFVQMFTHTHTHTYKHTHTHMRRQVGRQTCTPTYTLTLEAPYLYTQILNIYTDVCTLGELALSPWQKHSLSLETNTNRFSTCALQLSSLSRQQRCCQKGR